MIEKEKLIEKFFFILLNKGRERFEMKIGRVWWEERIEEKT